eukprot:830971-Prorocentrum_minimum.AAC.1
MAKPQPKREHEGHQGGPGPGGYGGGGGRGRGPGTAPFPSTAASYPCRLRSPPLGALCAAPLAIFLSPSRSARRRMPVLTHGDAPVGSERGGARRIGFKEAPTQYSRTAAPGMATVQCYPPDLLPTMIVRFALGRRRAR